MFGKLLTTFIQAPLTKLPVLSKEVSAASTSLVPNSLNFFWNATTTRSKMRYYFPRPNERQRIRKFGWKTRMSTLGGRKVIWNRILKGKYILTH